MPDVLQGILDAYLAALRGAFDNPALAQPMIAALTATVSAGALVYLRNLPVQTFRFLERQLVVSVDVPQSSDAFGWLCEFLDRHPYSRKARRLTVTAAGSRYPNGERSAEPRILYTPAPGHHLLWFRGRPVWLARERKDLPARDGGFGGYQETFTLRMFGRSAEACRALFAEAHALALAEERRVAIYTAVWGEWRRLQEVVPRPLNSVTLAETLAEEIVEDATLFLARRDWYTERGIPWRRGWKFEGPPGTGKTSFIGALAGHLGLNLYVLNLGSRGLSDQGVMSLLLNVPPRSVVLLEDIDGVVQGRTVEGDGVTFAGLLNALDGIASQPGLITIMTTNHPEKLDPALVRDGRVDRTWTFGPATVEQAERFFLHFYGDTPEHRALARTFGEHGAGRVVAELQGICLRHADAAQALAAARRPPLAISA